MPDTQPDQTMLQDATIGAAATTAAAPTAEPPTTVQGQVGVDGIGASTWINGKKINALWTINENRNSWMSVAGTGWVKLANNSDSAIVALTMLAASARQTQTPVNYRQESDTMVHEMYVW